MKGNLVLLSRRDATRYVSNLTDNFKIEADFNGSEFYIDFINDSEREEDYTRLSFVDVDHRWDLIAGMNNLDKKKRDDIIKQVCEIVTNDIIKFIIKMKNLKGPFVIDEYIGKWFELFELFYKLHTTNPAD